MLDYLYFNQSFAYLLIIFFIKHTDDMSLPQASEVQDSSISLAAFVTSRGRSLLFELVDAAAVAAPEQIAG